MSALAPELVNPTTRKRLNNSLNLGSIADGSTPGVAEDTLASEAHTEASKLWLLSRRTAAPGKYRPPGEERPFTLQNVRLAIRLLQLSGPHLLRMFMAGQEWRMVMYVLWTFSRGILPTWRIWASSRMLDLVQESFEKGGIDRGEVTKVALASILSATGGDALQFLLGRNTELIKIHVDTILRRAYLSNQLSLPISTLSSPFISSLLREAGIFIGAEHASRASPNGPIRMIGLGGPFDTLSQVFHLLATLTGMISQLYVMFRALSIGDASTVLPGWSSGILIALSLAPTMLRTLDRYLKLGHRYRSYRDTHDLSEQDIQAMARAGPYKQEAMLFGLKDWVLARWDVIMEETKIAKLQNRRDSGVFDLGLHVVEESVQTSFYVLLALQVLPTTLSLGSFRLYQRSAEMLLQSLRSLSRSFNRVFQLIFLIAAYTEAIDLPNHPHLLRPLPYRDGELLDFESHRVGGGMELVARGLGYRYPGTSKDVLHDINLTIKPGTTFAIVGVNGGGKTTLVKALMGLYDHQGSLFLNGHPMAAYDPVTVHRRTSCLFQDFCKYSFSLRENVGIGNVSKVEDGEAVSDAIERGGARGVLGKVGMEGKLNRSGVPDSLGQEAIVMVPPRKATAMGTGAAKGSLRGLVGRVAGMLRTRPSGGGAVGPDSAVIPGERMSNGSSLLETPLTSPSPSDASPSKSRAFDHLLSPPVIKQALQGLRAERASLSGGQWQKVALSRSFMRASEADLVVFDEPSASLDPRAEAQLFERIHALSHQNGRRCTTIFISHRYSTVKRADQIAVVEDGTIVECGSHAELMEMEGRYAELYNLQRSGFDD